MIAFIKAVPFGIALTILVALFVGSGGGTGGMLNVRPFDVDIAAIDLEFRLYWSWMLFLIGTGLAWFLLLMMGD